MTALQSHAPAVKLAPRPAPEKFAKFANIAKFANFESFITFTWCQEEHAEALHPLRFIGSVPSPELREG